MSRSRSFVFTWNNYDVLSLAVLSALDCKYLVFGKEVAPSTGTPHLQGYVVFRTQRSLSSVIKKLNGAHVEVAKGDAEQNYAYVTKGGDFVEVGEKPLTSLAAGLKGVAARAAKNKLLLSGNLLDLVSSGELHLSQVPLIKKARMILAAEGGEYSHDDVRGIWYWGPPGSGKSRKAREWYPGAYLKQQNKWFDGYEGQDTVILDDLDTDVLGHYLKIWMDRYACTAETKNGMTQLRHHRFVVTSNYSIEELFKDNPVMAQAIRRRCIVTHFGEHVFNPNFERIEMPEL